MGDVGHFLFVFVLLFENRYLKKNVLGGGFFWFLKNE
jgi:hypothetical protein